MRTNQLPIPASGARIARFGSSTPPMSNGSVSAGIGNPFLGPVALPDQAQSGECEEVVDVVYLVAERCDRGGQAASRDRGRLDAELLADPAEDAVDLTGEAVDDSRTQRSL